MFAYLQPRYPTAINVNWHGVVPGSWPGDVTQAEAVRSPPALHYSSTTRASRRLLTPAGARRPRA